MSRCWSEPSSGTGIRPLVTPFSLCVYVGPCGCQNSDLRPSVMETLNCEVDSACTGDDLGPLDLAGERDWDRGDDLD